MAKKKMTKPQIKKSHKLAEKLKKAGSKVRNPFAVATAAVKKAARKRKAAKKKKR